MRGIPLRTRQRVRFAEDHDPADANLERVPGLAARGEGKPLERHALSIAYPVADGLLIFECSPPDADTRPRHRG